MKTIKTALLTILAVALGAFALGAWWIHQPVGVSGLEFTVESGSGSRAAAKEAAKASASNDLLMFVWFRVSGQSNKIKAGTYAVQATDTPKSLLKKLVTGEEVSLSLTIPEGWTFKQMRQAVERAPHLKISTNNLSDEQLMAAIGKSGSAEGRFFPDTYKYAKNSSDVALYKLAASQLDKVLQAAWDKRLSGVPLKSPDELLILASIVEKETGLPSDRAEIAGVFANRLRIGMLLQTDPTVIYGMGERFNLQRRNITKADLQRDTPYNTYTRAGLPPTPISLVGRAALTAAANPKATDALYFVARGDGSSQFSATLAEHNRAVQTFILKR